VQTLVRLVEHPGYANISGKYYDASGREMRTSAEVGQVRLQDQLWETSRLLADAAGKGSGGGGALCDGLGHGEGQSNGVR